MKSEQASDNRYFFFLTHLLAAVCSNRLPKEDQGFMTSDKRKSHTCLLPLVVVHEQQQQLPRPRALHFLADASKLLQRSNNSS
jgi:hypothetical protein